jgi:alpha-L-fucosidase
MTTRHHDGFAMWPSDASDFGVKQFLPGVDLVKKFAEGCRANSLKVGFYYSPPDWHFNRDYMTFNYGSKDQKRFPGGPDFDMNHHPVAAIPVEPEAHRQAYLTYIKRQVTELLTRYGKVDVLWFDGGPNAISIDEIRAMQPGIVVNPRMHGYGDFATPEMKMPDRAPDGWWELCATWAGGWGYNKSHENYRSAGWMLQYLAHVRSWGGNYLINVGPRADGTLPESYYVRMKEVSAWMKHSGVSIFGVKSGPYPQRCNAPVTIRENIWYVHLATGFTEPVKISGATTPVRVRLLRNGAPVTTQLENGTLTFQLPAGQRTDMVDVVSLEWN